MRAKLGFGLVAQAGLMLFVVGCESSCSGGGNRTNNSVEDPTNTLAAVVNGSEIFLSTLDDQHKKAVEKLNRTGRKTTINIEREMRASILRTLIDNEIFKQQAKEKGVEVDRFERVSALEQYKARIGGPKAYEVYLREQGFTDEQMQEVIMVEQLRDKLVEKASGKITVAEQELKAYYEANKRIYTLPEMVRVRHLLLKLTADEPAEKAELVFKKANQIMQEARDSQVSFESLVEKYSEGPSSKTGGDLGFFPRGRMVKSFEDAAFNAQLKTPVGPIKTDFGYHIIYVEERSQPKEAPLETVRDRIEELMKRNKRSVEAEKMLTSLRKSADVKIFDPSMTQEEYFNLLDPKRDRKKPAEQAPKG